MYGRSLQQKHATSNCTTKYSLTRIKEVWHAYLTQLALGYVTGKIAIATHICEKWNMTMPEVKHILDNYPPERWENVRRIRRGENEQSY